jgi:hypothetical protein
MLKKLLFINGLFTAIGGILLIFLPNQLMQIFGIQLPQNDFFIYYLLGVISISFSVLSFSSMKLKDQAGLQIIAFSFLIFHISEAVVGIYEFTNGFSSVVLGNAAIHIIFSVFFWYSGLRKKPA